MKKMNDFYEELLDKQNIDELLGEAKGSKINWELENVLQRDENGKPILSLTPLEKTAVNTPTQEDYDVLMQVYECGGWKWNLGELPTQFNCLNLYKEKTCVYAGIDFFSKRTGIIRFNDMDFYRENDWKVIFPQEFYDTQNPKIHLKMLKEINKWFDKYKPNRASKG